MFRYLATVVLAASVPLAGQWLKYPTPGMPRTTDGPRFFTKRAHTARSLSMDARSPEIPILPGWAIR